MIFPHKRFRTFLNVSSVYTLEVMPPKRARVSAECAIANIMHLWKMMTTVTELMVKSVMLKMIWIVYMGRQVSAVVRLFIY